MLSITLKGELANMRLEHLRAITERRAWGGTLRVEKLCGIERSVMLWAVIYRGWWHQHDTL
jgi:hypothetical protein